MKHLLSGAVLVLSAAALWWRIDGTVLWRDEASTACWAREMIERKSLVPRVFNGERLIVQAPDGHDFDDRYLPAMQGWLQFYVAALGMLVAGAGTLGARLPFVIAGAASLWVLYRVGREMFPGAIAALALPLAGATSIYFLTAARQARYYILVVLFTSLILLEFARALRDEDRSWGFHLRLGLWGLLTYLANYVSFAGLWASLGAFILFTRDGVRLRRFLLLSGVLGVVLGAQFLLVHAGFVTGSPAARSASWADYGAVLEYHGHEMVRLIPLAAILPAAWYLFRWKRQPVSPMAVLAAVIIVVSVAATLALARTVAISRYYFQILPALLLLVAILAERLAAVAGRAWAAAFFLFCLAWPNLNFYHGWSEHAVERQLTRDQTCNEPLVEFLRGHVRPDESIAFHRNVQGMMSYFNLPWLKWVAILDIDEPRNHRLRGVLPPYLFDDFEGVDWYVVWDNRGKMPRKFSSEYQLVWQHTYTDPKSWWNRDRPDKIVTYRVYRRAGRPAP